MNNPEGIKALVAKWRADAAACTRAAFTESSATFLACADELESLTAVAGDAEVVARELLTAEYKRTHDANPRANLGEAEYGIALRAVQRGIEYGRAITTRQAVEGMVLVPREPTEAAVDRVAHTLWIYEGGSLSWTLLRVKTKYRTLAKHAIASYLAAAAPQAGKGDGNG